MSTQTRARMDTLSTSTMLTVFKRQLKQILVFFIVYPVTVYRMLYRNHCKDLGSL